MNFSKLTLLLCAVVFFSCKKPTVFQQIPSSHSGIHFNNKITETDSINPLDIVNINKGDFKFEDVIDKAGVGGLGRWGRGVSVIDINNDGLMDIYVCNTIYSDSNRRRNLLYINQGIDKDGIPHL